MHEPSAKPLRPTQTLHRQPPGTSSLGIHSSAPEAATPASAVQQVQWVAFGVATVLQCLVMTNYRSEI